MHSIGILTDTSIQFAQPVFEGSGRIRILPMEIEVNGRVYTGETDLTKLDHIWETKDHVTIRRIPASEDMLVRFIDGVLNEFDEILAIFLSDQLNPTLHDCLKVIIPGRTRRNIHLVDSQTFTTGLGFLVQTACNALDNGEAVAEVERLVRSWIPHIFTVISTSNLAILHQAGYLDHAQTQVGDMLGLQPLFTLEDGTLSPLDKVRSRRNIIDFFQEFLDEFESLRQISLLHGNKTSPSDIRMLQDYAAGRFPHTSFADHPVNITAASLFGPQMVAMVAVENDALDS